MTYIQVLIWALVQNDQYIFKSRLSLIVRLKVVLVLNRTVVVDSADLSTTCSV